MHVIEVLRSSLHGKGEAETKASCPKESNEPYLSKSQHTATNSGKHKETEAPLVRPENRIQFTVLQFQRFCSIRDSLKGGCA